MAQVALSSNSGCIGATDPNIACMGTCRSLYDTVISSCDNEVSHNYNYIVNFMLSSVYLLIASGADTQTRT